MNQTDQILKKKLSLSKRTLLAITIGMIAFYVLSVAFGAGIRFIIRKTVRSQAVSSITNISQLNKDSVSRAIANRRTLLETLSARIERQNMTDTESILKELSDFGSSYDFYNIGYIDKSGAVYLVDGTVLDVSDVKLTGMIDNLWDGQFHLTESYLPYTSEEYMVNTFSCPVFREGEQQYVLVAGYFSKNLTERMNISSMEGKGDSFLLNRQGEVVIYPRHYENEEYTALMKYINDTPAVIPDANGDTFFIYNGERYFAHFDELGINDWLLMTCLKEDDVYADAQPIMDIVFLSMTVLWLTIFCAIGYHFYYVRRIRLRRTKETFYDELLDIPNKTALSVIYEELPPQLLDQMYLVIFDIDKFKEFNYIHGSEKGDELLKYIVQVLRDVEPDVYLFRYMSDYFVVLDRSESDETYRQKIEVVLERFARDADMEIIPPFDISAGVRKIQPGDSLPLIISDALVARETVKGNHMRAYAFYDENIRNKRLRYMELETDFPAALREKEFQVYYQPKFDMRTGEIIGAEALARWVRPDGSIISPREFIPCLEASRQVMALDEEILSEVCRHMNEMEDEGMELRPVSVNLSRVHLRNSEILSKIEEILHRFGVDPELLSFEITETVLFEDSIPLKNIVDGLHALGCRVEMDDYGVGASGPNSLANNSFDVVKLDKSLVDGLGNERVEDVIRSTANMARKWGMDVLIEGVEEQSQAERLVELGCSYAQGFYYSMPIPKDDYRALLRADESSAVSVPKVPMVPRYFPDEVCAVLDGNLLPTYIIDPEHFVVMYCNKALTGNLEEDPTGGLCYKKLRGKDHPCEECAAMRFYREGDNTPKEIQNFRGEWLLLQTSPLYWRGREFVQITFVDISRQKQMEAELFLRSKEYEVIVQQNITGVMRYDIAADTATVNVDGNLDRVEEYAVTDCIRTARESGMIAPDSLPMAAAMMEHIKGDVPSQGYDIQILPRQGEPRWCHFDYSFIKDDNGQPYRAVISFYDNTEQKEKELEYQNWNAGLSALVDEHTIYTGVNLSRDLVESENRFGTWNQSGAVRRFGDYIERIADEWVVAEYIREFYSFFNRERLLGLYYAGQKEDSLEYLSEREGSPQWYRVTVQMANDPVTNDVKASLVFHHVDAEVRERERLTNEAERDSLTGLYNRATTERLICEVLGQFTGERCCFLIIDLDDLRGINSSLGHPEGDKALKAIADTMRSKFRKGDILGRIGGDEFVAFLRNVPEADALRTAVFEFMCRIRKHTIGPENERSIHVSIGGTIGTAGRDDFKTIYEQADLAMYYTKANGKNAFNFYIPEMENRDFVYQPHYMEAENKTDWYETIEVRRLVKAMSAFFPLVFSVNLTRNTYCIMEYQPYIEEIAEGEGAFDDLVEIGKNAFHPDDQEKFLAKCSRESLLQAYSEGKRIVGYKGRQRGADGIYRMAQTVVLFMEERETGDICQITFAHVVHNQDDKENEAP